MNGIVHYLNVFQFSTTVNHVSVVNIFIYYVLSAFQKYFFRIDSRREVGPTIFAVLI